MTEDEKRIEWITEQFEKLLLAAIDHDGDTAARTVTEVGERYGNDGVYGLCCALADVVRVLAFPNVAVGDGTLTGVTIAVIDVPVPGNQDEDHPHDRWAASFVATYINGDMGTNSALFYTSVQDSDLAVARVSALIHLAGSLGRQREQGRR